jgi:hypothetical protein
MDRQEDHVYRAEYGIGVRVSLHSRPRVILLKAARACLFFSQCPQCFNSRRRVRHRRYAERFKDNDLFSPASLSPQLAPDD